MKVTELDGGPTQLDAYSEPEPHGSEPVRDSAEPKWQFAAPRLIFAEWHDADAHWANGVMAAELVARPSQVPHEGVEALACPCGNYEKLTVVGSWDGPLTLECPCSSPFRASSDAPWAVNLLKRLILWHADATSELRQLNDLIIEQHTAHQIYRERFTDLVENGGANSTAHDLRTQIRAPIPDRYLLPLAHAVGRREEYEPTRPTRLQRVLREVRLTPESERPRYAGGPLTRYLIRGMVAVAGSGDRDLQFTEEGRCLMDTIDRVTADIREHNPDPTATS